MTREEILKQEIKQAEFDINYYGERLEKAKLLLEVLKKEQENLKK